MSSGKFDKIIGNKKDRILIDAFYSGRNYAPLWITDGKASDQAKAAINYLHHVDADGLDPADYPVPDFATLKDPADLAEADLKLSMAVITYAHHASVGRVHWSRVSADIFYDQKPPEPADVLAKLVEAKDTGSGAEFLRAADSAISRAQSQARRIPGRQHRESASRGLQPDRPRKSAPRTTASRSCVTGSAFPATAARLMTRRWPRR